jgi:HAMP domain-containing protein/type II secretory pathway pseudopilin PulG
MKLLLKFNLIVVVIVAIGLAIVSWVAHSFLIDNARAQVVQQAELMMQSATSTRDYTTEELAPLIRATPAMEHDFLPQIVPAYGATVTFARLRKKFPEYIYKEATLNPTNLQDRAVDWETDIIEAFRNKPDLKEYVGERQTTTGPSLYLAHPIVAHESCLECHSVPSAAPKVMIDKYGSTNGFGWKLNETIGAQIVSVPMELPVQIANTAFKTLMWSLVATFAAILVAVDIVLYFLIIVPIRKLSTVADKVSLGQLDQPELPVRGKDEMAQLTTSFNRLVVTVVKALRMLGN